MTRVLQTHDRQVRQGLKMNKRRFIARRPAMYSRQTAAAEWDKAYATHGNDVLRRDLSGVWKGGGR